MIPNNQMPYSSSHPSVHLFALHLTVIHAAYVIPMPFIHSSSEKRPTAHMHIHPLLSINSPFCRLLSSSSATTVQSSPRREFSATYVHTQSAFIFDILHHPSHPGKVSCFKKEKGERGRGRKGEKASKTKDRTYAAATASAAGAAAIALGAGGAGAWIHFCLVGWLCLVDWAGGKVGRFD